MAITSTGLNVATSAEYVAPQESLDKTELSKDDFMKLLLVELQHQDPTEPMDSEKILSQTSQLATLEASTNTTNSLDNLSNSLVSSQEFSTIAAIGKKADLGSDTIAHEKGTNSTFEIYFDEDISSGSVDFVDAEGSIIHSINIDVDEDTGMLAKGVHQFSWDGMDASGNLLDSGVYAVQSSYVDTTGATQSSRLGIYPIESVRFDEGSALVKLGSSYIPIENIVEVYE